MARKFTSIRFVDDEATIKNMLNVYNSEIRFIKVSYVRNDRVIDMKTNKVYIDDAPEQTYSNTFSVYRNGGADLALDKIANARLDEEGKRIVGKKVYLAKTDDVFEIGIEKNVLADLVNGRFHFHDVPIAEFISDLKKIPDLSKMADEIQYVSQFYPDSGINLICSMWYRVNKYDLYSLLGDYSKLILYSNSIYHKEDSVDFFDSIKIPKEFLFRLTNYYLNSNNNSHSFFYGFQKDGNLWKFYEQLPDECKIVFLEEAKSERFDIANVISGLSFRSGDILAHISKSHEFFNDYLRKAKVSTEEDILTSYYTDAKNLLRYNMELTLENLNNLKFVKKAEQMGIGVHEFFGLVDNINTKNGIINYLLAENR